jgi:hypothetical protein
MLFIFYAVLPLFIYYALCRYANTTTIAADESEIIVRHGPVPWPLERNRRISLKGDVAFMIGSRTERNRSSTGMTFYRAEAVVRDGGSGRKRTVPITPWFEDEDVAKAVTAALREQYGSAESRQAGEPGK